MKTAIEMAREAGFVVCRDESMLREMLERFAELVRADERQRAALKVEELGMVGYGTLAIAAAIRARSQA